ncbi:hypothetical protein [Endozoicomonas sp. Mp262]|uniref:hypothetical protein n=1 Tax=Endozoicomonas sp. Mp262 TaxID=2919499 RepID=UPI0021D94D53
MLPNTTNSQNAALINSISGETQAPARATLRSAKRRLFTPDDDAQGTQGLGGVIDPLRSNPSNQILSARVTQVISTDCRGASSLNPSAGEPEPKKARIEAAADVFVISGDKTEDSPFKPISPKKSVITLTVVKPQLRAGKEGGCRDSSPIKENVSSQPGRRVSPRKKHKVSGPRADIHPETASPKAFVKYGIGKKTIN